MVRLCLAGGRLSEDINGQLATAARLHAEGHIGKAAELYHRILDQSPHQAEALHSLGVIAQQRGRPELALQLFDAALTAAPDMLQARFNRGLILHSFKRDEEALQTLRQTVAAAPGMAEAWDLIGQILKDAGSYDEAAQAFTRALALRPDHAPFRGNYALLLLAQGDLVDAYREALAVDKRDPSYPPMLLGNILKSWGYPEKAAPYFARVRELMPSFADAAASEAMEYLQMGDFEKGWALWEKRPDLAPDALKKTPLWQGQKTAGLLLYEDQGIGDAIQFMRYIPLLKEHAETITLFVNASLQRLCAENFPFLHVVSDPKQIPTVDARCRLSSLPFFFKTRAGNIPAAPYLGALSSPSPLKGAGFDGLPVPRIGLCWAGNAKFHNDAARSIPFSLLQPLLACGAEHFVSLQKEHTDESVDLLGARPLLKDFADTAAVIAELDLVISVDTAVAHLAAALGKPVFLLVATHSDWRWFLGREDSPWYPTLRLFRQKTPGNWEETLQRVTNEVRKSVAGDTNVLIPPVWHGHFLRQHPDATEIPLS